MGFMIMYKVLPVIILLVLVGFARVWHDTAIPFTEVLESFEEWMEGHSLYDRNNPTKLTRAAFVTW